MAQRANRPRGSSRGSGAPRHGAPGAAAASAARLAGWVGGSLRMRTDGSGRQPTARRRIAACVADSHKRKGV